MSPKGGRREGAGRPRAGKEKMIIRSVWMEPADWKRAEEYGDGIASVGIRRLIHEKWEEQEGRR